MASESRCPLTGTGVLYRGDRILGFTLGFQVKPVDAGCWMSCIQGVMHVLMKIQ